jgi:hypothetical protein
MTTRWRRSLAAWLLSLGVLAAVWPTRDASADTAPAAAGGGPARPSSSAAPGGTIAGGTTSVGPARSPLATRLAETTSQIRDFLAERLAADIAPGSLFDIDIDDARAVDLERQRLSRLQAPPTAAGVTGTAKPAPAAAKPSARGKPGQREADEPVEEGGAPAAADDGIASADEVAARLALDRARLAFYTLPVAERQRLLDVQKARQEEHAKKPDAQIDEAERRAREAEAERLAALESARTARTEALRLVSEEHARLLQVAQRQAEFEKSIVGRRAELARREESVLGWHRKVREAIDAAAKHDSDGAEVDFLYESLRKELRAARDMLANALSDLHAESSVPAPGEDRLSGLPPDVPAEQPRAKRKEVEAEYQRLAAREAELRQQAQRTLYDEVISLNRDRLALYPFLSSARRGQIVGFGPEGFDQAKAEGRQVLLVVRQHLQATGQFLAALRAPGGARADSALSATLVAFKWLLPLAVFLIWRRRAVGTLTAWRDAAQEERRSHRSVTLSPAERLIAFVMRVRNPLEWLLLLASVVWLLPAAAKNTLEVSLLTSVCGWTLGGAAVVDTIDALTAGGEGGSRKSRLVTAHVRLRSLRLIGRVVVAVELILSVSDQLVGRGTIYSWVLSTCWFAAIPVVLALAHWWHDIIHERLSQRRRKTATDNWVLAHAHGWRRLLAAIVGGAVLLGSGAYRFLRHWLSTFDFSRRVLAYLFRRDMSRRTAAGIEYQRVPSDLFRNLGPETPSRDIVASIADDALLSVTRRIAELGGGLFAIVGERGAGKTTLLQRLMKDVRETRLIDCPLGGVSEFARALAEAGANPKELSLAAVAAALDQPGGAAALLIDDASRLIMPRMGGLDAFDEILGVARRHSTSCAWVFAFDEVVWRFFERARGARPLFDDVIKLQAWREEGIGRLLVSRTRAAGVSPTFRHLLTDLREDADEIDVNEATEQTATAYYRLIWDYAGGNPGIALHAWRLCLGITPDGETAVKVFDAPDATELESLPDCTVFVLRAVVQLGLAHPTDILRATMLESSEIEDALRFGMNRGYFKLVGERYWVTWAWFRPITRFLQRRYLLSSN